MRGVSWARVDPVLAQVIVSFEDGRVDLRELTGVLTQVEESHGAGEDDFPGAAHTHPADLEPIQRQFVALAADAAGGLLGVAARLLRFPALPVEIAATIPSLDSVTPLRRALEGHRDLQLALAGVNATLQGLTQGPLGLVVDGTLRASAIAELVARRRAWLAAEGDLCPAPAASCDHLPLVVEEVPPRPVPLPPSLVDRYGQAASLTSLAGAGVTLAVTANPRRTADVLLAGLPRAARAGTDAYAMHVGRVLANRGVIPMDPGALRRLDAMDTVVLDASVALTGRWELSEVVELPGAGKGHSPAGVVERLFDPTAPNASRVEGPWRLTPVEAGTPDTRWPRGSRTRARNMAKGGRTVLALSHHGEVAALAAVAPVLHPAAALVADAARRAAQDLVIAGTRGGVAALLGADATVAGGSRLAASVRTLQAEGRVVLLISDRTGGSLRAADCAVGVTRPDRVTRPWGAHLVCSDLSRAVSVVEATALARTASRHSVAAAALGSAAATVSALGPLPGASRRAMTALQVASLTSMGLATWTAARLPPPPDAPLPAAPPWHSMAQTAVLGSLGTRQEGLTTEEAAGRRGPGEVDTSQSLASLIGHELANPLTAVLAAGAGLSALTGSLVDAAMIAGVIGADAVLGALSRQRTEAAIAELSRRVSDQLVRAERGGEAETIPAGELVPGDVVVLRAGDVVTADARLLEVQNLEMDESPLTGESLPVAKATTAVDPSAAVADRTSMVYAGTAVAAGGARAVVVATGRATESGRAASGKAPPATGVESRLRSLTDLSVPVVLLAGAGVTLNSALRGRPVREAITAGSSLATAAVPEGLPFVATVAQAAAARRLAGRGVLVRNPQVLEALGRVDVLCFDKTGTLTAGHLQVARVSDGAVDEPLARLGPARKLVLAAALRATPRRRPGRLPHPTDQAIVDAGHTTKLRIGDGVDGWKKVATLPFEPARGFHAVFGTTSNGGRLSVKGAPEVVIPRCRTWRRPDGEVVTLDGAVRRQIEREVDRLARRGLRILAVAERQGAERTDLTEDGIAGLELAGLVGVADEARQSAVGPVRDFVRAGIKVVMITGDHPSTAEAVASDLGILNGGTVLTGPALAGMDDAELDSVIGAVTVFARVTPADKVRIVGAYQRTGRVVAMTGDGANDAQAIRLAEIGVAFGSRATPAAQAAADLVITNDDLSALLDSLAEGRAVWASVRDSLSVLLGGNLGEVLFATGASLATGRAPLTARQLLAVNLFTDLAPALALAVQPPPAGSIDLAREGPEASLRGALARDVAIRAAATAGGTFGAWALARGSGTEARARTVALAALVGTQLGQTAVVGRRSPLVLATVGLSAAGLVGMVQTPGLSQFFGCRPLGPTGWTIAAGSAGAATLASVVAGRLVPA